MAVFDNLNKTTSSGVAPGIIEFYQRSFEENVKPEMVHGRDAQKRTLPEKNGKYANFFRLTPFSAVTTPLSEGVTPAGQSLTETTFKVMVKPYGKHVEMTDELDLYHLNNMHKETAQLLSDQAALSLDTIERDAINAGMNVQFAGSNIVRGTIAATDKLTAADVKKAVRTLKRKNAKPFPDGFYHAIVHPDTVFDLTSDPQWIDVAKYQDKTKIERYELGCLYKVKFFESTNAKVFKGESYVYGTQANLTASANWDSTNKCFTTATDITDDQARELTGKLLDIQYTVTTGESPNTTTTTYKVPMCVEKVDAAANKIYFRWQPTDTTDWTTANTLKLVPGGAGASSADVYSTVIYGQNAYGDIELGGNGKNVQIIINAPGSSGALDPLAQRGTIAWKVKGFCCSILQDAFIVRIEHGATA